VASGKADLNTEFTEDTEKKEQLSGRGIGNFAEDGRTARASGGREIRRTLMERFISEKGESKSLLGVGGDAEARGGQNGEEGNLFCLRRETPSRRRESHFHKNLFGTCRGIHGTRRHHGKNRKLFVEQWILCAAAGDDDLVDLVFRQNETMKSVGDGSRGERGSRVDEVIGLGFVTAAKS